MNSYIKLNTIKKGFPCNSVGFNFWFFFNYLITDFIWLQNKKIKKNFKLIIFFRFLQHVLNDLRRVLSNGIKAKNFPNHFCQILYCINSIPYRDWHAYTHTYIHCLTFTVVVSSFIFSSFGDPTGQKFQDFIPLNTPIHSAKKLQANLSFELSNRTNWRN